MTMYAPLKLAICHRCHNEVISNQSYDFEGNSYFHRECGKDGGKQ